MRYTLLTLLALVVALAPVAAHAEDTYDYGDTLYTDGTTTTLDDTSAYDASSEALSFDSLEMLAQPTTASDGYAAAAPLRPRGPGMGMFRGFLLGTSSYEIVMIALPRASADGSSQGGFLQVGDSRFALADVQMSQGSSTVTTGDVQILATFAAYVVAPSTTTATSTSVDGSTTTAAGVIQGRIVAPASSPTSLTGASGQPRPGPGRVVFEGSLQLGGTTGTILALPEHGGPRGPRQGNGQGGQGGPQMNGFQPQGGSPMGY